VGDLPDIDFGSSGLPAGICGVAHPTVTGTVDDLVIFSSVGSIDGPGGILGQAGPCILRMDSGLPVVGVMQFDSADLAWLEADAMLDSTILHEMAHVLGVGSLWGYLGYLANPSLGLPAGTADTHFMGAQAESAFDAAGGLTYSALKVPVENELGGAGTLDAHWRESVFANELMTGFIESASNPLSRITVASLADMGYTVSYADVDAYTLPGSALRRSASSAVSVEDDSWNGPVFGVDENGEVVELSP